MKACGLIVEYNPLHNGHIYHLNTARKMTQADCMIAVMSGSFLQRGEPALIDKFHRTKMALNAGVDIVAELPFSYAVQSSQLFAKGAVQTLSHLGASSICFGSESGDINNFLNAHNLISEKQHAYTLELKTQMNKGSSFPLASAMAYKNIGLDLNKMDLAKPNNILGFSYVQEILTHQLPIEPLTIKRISNNYHDQSITNSVASATSIRNKLILEDRVTDEVLSTLPVNSIHQLQEYRNKTTKWHTWESYYPFLHYRIMTMSTSELSRINGVDEGIEHRIKDKIRTAPTFQDFVKAVKTKRYTWTRLQRMFVFILTNITKRDLTPVNEQPSVPFIRLLGLSQVGREYIKQVKKQIDIPIYGQLKKEQHQLLQIDERASHAYYSILPIKQRNKMRLQELAPPILI